MESVLYAILHCIYEATAIIALFIGMWGFAWMDTDDFEPISLLSLILPTIYAIAVFANAWAIGLTAQSSVKMVVLTIDSIMFIAEIAAAVFFSIKKYRDEGCKPNYAAFLIVVGYSFVLLLGSVLFTCLS